MQLAEVAAHAQTNRPFARITPATTPRADDPIQPERLPAPEPTPVGRDPVILTLDDVLNSVESSYPLVDVALAEIAAARGKALATWGNFDTQFSGYSISAPIGFYQNYQNGVKLSQPLQQGGELYGGYRIGDGNFQPWYGERQTNEGGEFKAGIKVPFWKDRRIDARRAEIGAAQLEIGRMDRDASVRILEMFRLASHAYWKWVAMGQLIQVEQRLVALAQDRVEQVQRRVAAGDLPQVTSVDNGRFIAKRQVKLIEAQRKLQEAAIKLSLFLRDETGRTVLPTPTWVPPRFPEVTMWDPNRLEQDVALAVSNRPDIAELDFQRQQVGVEMAYARNLTLPKLDGAMEGGQDVGAPASSKKDKSPFEFEAGIYAQVPLQRREGRGKIEAARQKLLQIESKRRFTVDKIRSQVQDAASAIDTAAHRVERARENLRLTERSLELGRLAFEAGDIDIIDLNIYETSLQEAQVLLIEAQFDYFAAHADYRATLAQFR